MRQPEISDIWLVQFPFSNLTATKLRPALVIAHHQQEVILVGIFSKIPTHSLKNTWVLIAEDSSDFQLTGLKKTSLIRTEKIATVDVSIFVRKLGILPTNLVQPMQQALKKALNLF
jgi:mRNA interferase MazF